MGEAGDKIVISITVTILGNDAAFIGRGLATVGYVSQLSDVFFYKANPNKKNSTEGWGNCD